MNEATSCVRIWGQTLFTVYKQVCMGQVATHGQTLANRVSRRDFRNSDPRLFSDGFRQGSVSVVLCVARRVPG